jgi:hypothetical protein
LKKINKKTKNEKKKKKEKRKKKKEKRGLPPNPIAVGVLRQPPIKISF